jgi:S1-C subfamily serine protease
VKEFLSQRGIAFKEYDVSLDREAAFRMIRLSGQQGVPVTTIDDQVVVGFDRRRLEQILASKSPARPKLGAAVADAAPRLEVDGAYVGQVKADSPAARAGLKPGDVIVEIGRQPVRNAEDVERIAQSLQIGEQVRLVYLRHGQVLKTDLVL